MQAVDCWERAAEAALEQGVDPAEAQRLFGRAQDVANALCDAFRNHPQLPRSTRHAGLSTERSAAGGSSSPQGRRRAGGTQSHNGSAGGGLSLSSMSRRSG